MVISISVALSDLMLSKYIFLQSLDRTTIVEYEVEQHLVLEQATRVESLGSTKEKPTKTAAKASRKYF